MIVGRPSRQEMFMQVAHVVAMRSTCQRAHVGCIITNSDGTSIKSMGYNGNARGLKDGCDTDQVGQCGCLHAEENALLKAPYGPPLTMYTTSSPCLACAKRILNSSVYQVYFDQPYRDDAGLRLLNDQGMRVDQVDGNLIWRERILDLEGDIRALNAEIAMKDTAIMCLMKLLHIDWKPGENAATSEFNENWLQKILSTTARVRVLVPDNRQKNLLVEVR